MDKQMIISIGRQCGSGGQEIGAKLAEHYGLKLYDRNIMQLLAEDMEKDPASVARMEEKLSGLLPKRRGGFEAKMKDLMNRLSASDELYLRVRSTAGAKPRSVFCASRMRRVGRGRSFVMRGFGQWAMAMN